MWTRWKRNSDHFSLLQKKIIEKNNFDKGISIRIESDIPIGAGLGSSSACCVAAAASTANLFSDTTNKEILELAIQAEKTIFPNSSGADCTVSVYGGIIEYQKEKVLQRLIQKMSFIS